MKYLKNCNLIIGINVEKCITEIIGSDIIFLSKTEASSSEPSTKNTNNASAEGFDDDIPF